MPGEEYDDFKDLGLDLSGLDFDLEGEQKEPTAEAIAELNAAKSVDTREYMTSNNTYGKIRPDPALDYSILDEYGLSGYDVFFVGDYGNDVFAINEAFLENTAAKFKEQGIGVYDCIWRLRENQGEMDTEKMRKFSATWRTSVRRLRDKLAPQDNSVFTMVRFHILSDNLHVAVSLVRATPQIYAAVDAQRRSQSATALTKVQTIERLKNYF